MTQKGLMPAEIPQWEQNAYIVLQAHRSKEWSSKAAKQQVMENLSWMNTIEAEIEVQ